MNPDQDQHRGNRLLAALRPRDYVLLEPHLQIVPIGEGEFLHLPGDEIEQVYFLHSGVVSLMALSALPAIVVFPVSSALTVVLSAILSVWFWQERLNNRALVGMALAILSAVLLNGHS